MVDVIHRVLENNQYVAKHVQILLYGPAKLKNIEKYFGDNHVLKNLNHTFESGKTNLIIGESGSGKTTLIKILVGLYRHDKGSVLFHGKDVSIMKNKSQRKLRQEIGMLFQGGALYDYMTVEENIMFPLRT